LNSTELVCVQMPAVLDGLVDVAEFSLLDMESHRRSWGGNYQL